MAGEDQQGSGAVTDSQAIENLLQEERTFPPSEAFVAGANAGPEIYDAADAD